MGKLAETILTPFGAGLGIDLFGGSEGQSFLNKLPVIGAFVKDPEQERLRRQMAAAGQLYDEYRPTALAANLNATNQALGAYQPVNAALDQLYGPGFGQSLQVSSPFGATPPTSPLTPGGNDLRSPVSEASAGPAVGNVASAVRSLFGGQPPRMG